MALARNAGFTSAIATNSADTAAGLLTPDRFNLPHAVSGATSGGIPYFSSTTAEETSALLATGQLMAGGGAGLPPTTINAIITGPTALRTYTFPDAAATIARTDAGQTFTGVNTMTAPVFVTSAQSPLVIGGAGVGSSLDLKSTSGIGTTDFIRFLVGNNGATEAMRIINSGFVGIMTPTPEKELDVVGNIRASNSIDTSGIFTASSVGTALSGFMINTSALIIDTDKSVPYHGIAWKTFSDASGNLGMYMQGYNGIRMYTTGLERLRINGSGSVGIGTVSPAGTLDVSGATSSTVGARGSDDATAFALNARKARGTVAAPTVITTGDDLLTISGYGYVGATNTYQEAARITFDSTGTISDSATGIGGVITFSHATVGAEPVTVAQMKAQHIVHSGTAPTITAGGGTNPSIVGADEAFTVTIGTGGTATSVEVTFANAFTTNPPSPSVQSDTDIVPFKVTPLTNKITITATAAFTAGSKLYCSMRGWE